MNKFGAALLLGALPMFAAVAASAERASESGLEPHIRLDTDVVTGSSERPKVLYILPWRGAAATPGLDAPPNPKLDRLFEPLDPDAHARELRYRERFATPIAPPE